MITSPNPWSPQPLFVEPVSTTPPKPRLSLLETFLWFYLGLLIAAFGMTLLYLQYGNLAKALFASLIP